MAKHTDVALVEMKDVPDVTWNSTRVVNIPVMADVDTAGGNAFDTAGLTERLTAIGVTGMNIDDGPIVYGRNRLLKTAPKNFDGRWERWFSNLVARTII